MKKALIFGITGQDGSYLSELLLEKNYEVHGIQRQASKEALGNITHLVENKKLILHYGDVTDSTNIVRLVNHIQPDEIYNLAAQSHVQVSFELPEYTAQADALGTLRILEAIRICGLEKKTKFYQASTSELFGKVKESPQTENTPFHPRSPYAVAKLYAYWITVNYREAYNIFACNGILFNHESPRRGENFVTRKITQCVAKIYLGSNETLKLGNLDSKRDWGYAKEYVEAMWLMLQQPKAEDFVISSGKTHSVREFVTMAFENIGITLEWLGSDINEKGIDSKTKKILVEIDPKYFRPAEVEYLCGNPIKAKQTLGWESKTNLFDLVKIMLKNDIELFKNNKNIILAANIYHNEIHKPKVQL